VDGLTIERVTEATPEVAEALAALLPQLGGEIPLPDDTQLRQVVGSDAIRLFVARLDGKIVGTLTLIVAPIATGYHGYIETVVVDEAARGRGIASRLVDAALDAAARAGAATVDLTSHPRREAANRLYARLGFERRETNVYRYRID
jgi:ribosomal protein S18 acetylase RimI-like enzyme